MRLAVYMRNKKEMFIYLLFGILTTLVNIVSFAMFDKWLGVDYKLAATLAWVLAVVFAFITNKIFVFQSKCLNVLSVLREFTSFIFFRGLSYLLDIGMMIFLIEVLLADSLLAKIAANVLVVIFNYFASKYVIFNTSNG